MDATTDRRLSLLFNAQRVRERHAPGDGLSCYLSKDDHNRKIRTRKQRTNVGKYSFVNRIIKSWNQLLATLLESFPCKLNMFGKRLKNVVTNKGTQVGIECR